MGRWASVQWTADSRVVCISGSNAGYSMFRGIVKSTGYPLHPTVSPFTSPSVRHRVPSHFNYSLATGVWGSLNKVKCALVQDEISIWKVELQLYSLLATALEGGEGSAARPGCSFYPRERPGTHCRVDWVGPRACLDTCGKSRPHGESITGPSKLQPVTIPTELFGTRGGVEGM